MNPIVVHLGINANSKLNNSIRRITILVSSGSHSPKPVLVVDIAKEFGLLRIRGGG